MKREAEWLNGYEHLHTGSKVIDGLCGDEFTHTTLEELRNELRHFLKRLNNLALVHGVSPDALDKLREMGK